MGTRLPPIRQLAADLGLAVNTIARSYRECGVGGTGGEPGADRDGGGRAGAWAADEKTAADVQRLLTEAARAYAATTRRLGIPDRQALAAVTVELAVDLRKDG